MVDSAAAATAPAIDPTASPCCCYGAPTNHVWSDAAKAGELLGFSCSRCGARWPTHQRRMAPSDAIASPVQRPKQQATKFSQVELPLLLPAAPATANQAVETQPARACGCDAGATCHWPTCQQTGSGIGHHP
jgi:hypothetical protein